MSEDRVTYFWCVPAAEDAARFQGVIDALADRQDAPCYMPHLSLASLSGPLPDLSPVLQTLHGLTLQPQEIAQTEAFTMSLFLRVERHLSLIQARETFEHLPGIRSSREFDPHLSLCYGTPPPGAEKQEAVQALLQSPIKFDRLVLVDIPAKVSTYDDIRAWKVVRSIPF